MSVPFTNPYDIPAGKTWQTLLDEITLAYSERLTVVYGPEWGYTPTEGTDVQRAGYWSTLQNFLEIWRGKFVDYVNGPLNPAGTAFLPFTLDTWRSAAGLNADGFRRVPDGVEWDGINDPVWSYGHMQAGDIIGPWIFEDLQKALSALKWIEVSEMYFSGTDHWYTIQEKVAGFLIPPLYIAAIYGISEDCATAKASHASQLAGISWDFGGNGGSVGVRYYRNFLSGDTHVWSSVQNTFKGYISSIPPAIAHSVDLYQLPTSSPDVPFFDFLGLGFSKGILKFWESFPESTATSHTQTTPIGQNTTNGFTTLGWSCPTPEEGRSAGLGFANPRWLFKWNFTNA